MSTLIDIANIERIYIRYSFDKILILPENFSRKDFS